MSWLEGWPVLGWFADLELREPALLWLLPVAALAFWIARRGFGSLRFSSLRILPAARKTWRTRLDVVPDLLVALAVAALVISLAGPRKSDASSTIRKQGIAIMMVIDISGSMRALDLSTAEKERTRLDAVIDVFHDFVLGDGELPGRRDDAIGLVSFAGFADTRSPLTLDHDNLMTIADALEIVRDRAEDGTAIGDGLGLAVERLRRSEAKSRIAILLTDGVNNRGEESPQGAAQLAEAVGVKVYTIGAGTNGLAPIRAPDPFSGRMVLRQVPVEIDEQTLEDIADKTGGQYFRATDAAALREVYQQIDRLERTDLEEERYRRYRERFQLFIAAGVLLLLLAWLLRASVFRRVPC
ncbi:MAG: VWA domain-containing protein [Deltaproteobacteria bacterium]|jgi:Ca-activated chloride channel family protein|nr:VWA domain-containing protein [Deltaproteobacteria bacterium]